MKKKILLFILTGILGMALCGCQGNQTEETVQSTEQEETKENNIAEDTTEHKEEEKEEGVGIGLQIGEQVGEQTEEQSKELTEEQKVEIEHEQDPNYMGDMYDPWASETVDDVDVEFVDETDGDGMISTQLNVAEDYGYIEEKDFKFVNEFDETLYYYEMELFHFNEGAVPEAVISYINSYYEEKEAGYKQYGEELMDADWKHRLAVENGEIEDDEDTMSVGIQSCYSKMFFQNISYIGDDYVSLVYYEGEYMGGVREYGMLESITIDCKTGKEVTATEILGIQNDAELRCEISDKMGVEQLLTWDELDYYITDKAIVFYGQPYWAQGNYDDVIIWR